VITVLDFETTFITKPDKTTDPSPMRRGNYLVSAGYWTSTDESEYLCFHHNHQEPTEGGHATLQDVLARTRLLVAHNAKFELMWLRETGFVYDKRVWCTQVAEYVLARAVRKSFKLKDILEDRGLSPKRTDLTQSYLDNGVGFEDMPWGVVEEYGLGDVRSTMELVRAQLAELGMKSEEFV
tara:strand:- start:160 stop:702 length:543 start_codon:yes stop_codon:yes gene_type:complete